MCNAFICVKYVEKHKSKMDLLCLGLKTAMIEMYDFGSGTSSRSTKLIHGGVRYLQKAVFNLDIEQVKYLDCY